MYKPLVNDYVKWETRDIEGWVYYVDSENEYLTIEIAVTDKASAST